MNRLTTIAPCPGAAPISRGVAARGSAACLLALLLTAGVAQAQAGPASPAAAEPTQMEQAAPAVPDATPEPAVPVSAAPTPEPVSEVTPTAGPREEGNAPAGEAAGVADTVPQGLAPVTGYGPQAAAPDLLPHGLSPIGMFLAADWVVKGVMICLALASVITWTILLAKSLEIIVASRRLRRGLAVLFEAPTLAMAEDRLGRRRGPVAAMVGAARHEADTAPEAVSRGDGLGLLSRVSSHVARIEVGSARRLNGGIGMLATIGAVAPFVGLFGTVWGIMNSFINISEAQTTNLAVVAPGIAEALLATAIGLIAAIPAVVVYNLFTRWIAGYRARLADAAAAVERLVSRDLDHGRLVPLGFASARLPRAAE